MKPQSSTVVGPTELTFDVKNDGRVELVEAGKEEAQVARDITGDVIQAMIRMLEITGSLSIECHDGQIKEISLSSITYIGRILH